MSAFARMMAFCYVNPLARNSKAAALAHFRRFCANCLVKALNYLNNPCVLAQCAITRRKANDFSNYPCPTRTRARYLLRVLRTLRRYRVLSCRDPSPPLGATGDGRFRFSP